MDQINCNLYLNVSGKIKIFKKSRASLKNSNLLIQWNKQQDFLFEM